MIFAWIMTAIIGLIGLAIAGMCIYAIAKKEVGIGCGIARIAATLAITLAICSGIQWWLNCTESGKRAIKSTESSIEGIERTVTVYDVNGNEIESYSGKFDVDYDAERIIFDDEDGKRHIIYYSTGTVTINEN